MGVGGGRLEGGRLGEVSRLGQLGGLVGRWEDFNKCGVGREDGRGGVQTCERDGRWW